MIDTIYFIKLNYFFFDENKLNMEHINLKLGLHDQNDIDTGLFIVQVSETSFKEIINFVKEYQKIPVSQKDRVFFRDHISYIFKKCEEILTSYHKNLQHLKIFSIEFKDNIIFFYMSKSPNHPLFKIIPITQ